MTHNPYANASGARAWTPWEDDMLQLVTWGWTFQEISGLLDGRTVAAVKCRLHWKNCSPEKKKLRATTRRYRAKQESPDMRPFAASRVVPPDCVLEDRNRRYAAQQSLTAILMGDPCR